MAITHAKVSAKSDGADATEVLPSDWNASHTIASGTVTLAQMADIATARLIGRTTAGTGVPEALSVLPAALEPAHTGDVTNSAGSLALTIANDAVTYAKMQNVAANNVVLGRIAGAGGDTQELTAANIKTILALAASEIAFTPVGTIAATDVQAAIAEMLTEFTTQVTFAKEGTLATATGAFRWYNDTGRTLTFTSTRASVTTVPTGAAIIVDVNKDGTTIFTTQASRPTIAISGNTAQGAAPDVTTIANGSYLTVDIDQIGSTIAGSNLTVQIFMKG